MSAITPASHPLFVADLLDTLARLLRERAGAKVDIDVNRLAAKLVAELADLNRKEAGVRPMTVIEAADAACVSVQTVRNWCLDHHIGNFDRGACRWRVDRGKMQQYLIKRFGRLPSPLIDK